MNIFSILTGPISEFIYLFLFQLSNYKCFLMANKYLLTYGKEWYYLTGIMSKHNGNFYYFNCLHSFRTKTNLNLIKRYVKIDIFVKLQCSLKINQHHVKIILKIIHNKSRWTYSIGIFMCRIWTFHGIEYGLWTK